MEEFQAAYTKARMEANFKDERDVARNLLDDHEAVVMMYVTRYCPYTDAILGQDVVVQGAFETVELAEKFIEGKPDYGDDVNFFLWRKNPVKWNVPQDDDDIPF